MIPTPIGKGCAGAKADGSIEPLSRIDRETGLRMEPRGDPNILVQPMLARADNGMDYDCLQLFAFTKEQAWLDSRLVASVQTDFPTGPIQAAHHVSNRHGAIT